MDVAVFTNQILRILAFKGAIRKTTTSWLPCHLFWQKSWGMGLEKLNHSNS
jgi:hypothetical protein